jgi:hypothetical protein
MTGLAAALSAAACGERRRAADQMVRVAVAAPATPVPAQPLKTAAAPSNCGQPGAPECPLQAWMDNRLNAALSTGDYAEVTRAFRELVEDAPESFSSWAVWAERGALAAERHDDAGIRRACSGCHDQNRETYRRTMRNRAVRTAAAENP